MFFSWKIGIILFIIIVGLGIWYYYRQQKKQEEKQSQYCLLNQCQTIAPTETIFVMIPSNRDPNCAKSICDLFLNAYCPFRIFVGVYELLNSELQDIDCRTKLRQMITQLKQRSTIDYKDYSFMDHNLRLQTIDVAKETKKQIGSNYLLAQIQESFYRGELYIMILNSSTVLCEHWDRIATEQLNRCRTTNPNCKPILTMKTPSSQGNNQQPAYFLCANKTKSTNGFITIGSRPLARIPTKPLEQLFWSPAFSFTYSAAHIDVPFDPTSKIDSLGNEIALSTRFWTYGWDFYVPFTKIAGSVVSEQQTNNKKISTADRRIQYLLKTKRLNNKKKTLKEKLKNLELGELYGLGPVRRLDQYESFAHINLKQKKVECDAILGMVDPNDPIEILCKYGSNENYIWNRKNIQ